MRKTSATLVVASCLVALLAGPAHAANADVHIVGGAPSPATVTINEGDTVTFRNDDDVEHTIFALGQPQAAPIPPGGAQEFGPFRTGGEAGRFDYRVDRNGPAGTIFVQGPPPTTTPPTTRPSTTTAPPTTATTTPTTTTTTTTAPTTTSATSTSVASTTTTQVASQTEPRDKDTTNRLAVLGFALLVAGMGGMVIALGRSRRRRVD